MVEINIEIYVSYLQTWVEISTLPWVFNCNYWRRLKPILFCSSFFGTLSVAPVSLHFPSEPTQPSAPLSTREVFAFTACVSECVYRERRVAISGSDTQRCIISKYPMFGGSVSLVSEAAKRSPSPLHGLLHGSVRRRENTLHLGLHNTRLLGRNSPGGSFCHPPVSSPGFWLQLKLLPQNW